MPEEPSEIGWVWRKVRTEDVLWLVTRERRMMRSDIYEALTSEPYSLDPLSEGYLSDLVNGKRPLPNTEIGAALLHYLGLTLNDLGVDKSHYRTVMALLDYARQNGWPQLDGVGSGHLPNSKTVRTTTRSDHSPASNRSRSRDVTRAPRRPRVATATSAVTAEPATAGAAA